jgi:hypothetical protein
MAGLVRTFVAKLIEIYCLTADTFVFVTELNLLDDLLAHFWQADISILQKGCWHVWCRAGSVTFLWRKYNTGTVVAGCGNKLCQD